ncbi:nuclear transport factor 2 family protein [Inquilinus limosus]|uniref:nuclear transport factor 2 family protein n=1 Tax=Inquilinus limosus TaxID=171674 RepID=UPI003F18EE7E
MTDLERLVAIEAIRSLQSRYVRLADGKDWGALARLFLPRGTFVVYDLKAGRSWFWPAASRSSSDCRSPSAAARRSIIS